MPFAVILNPTPKAVEVDALGVPTTVPPMSGAWTADLSHLRPDTPVFTCSHGHKTHAHTPDGVDLTDAARHVTLHTPHVHACSVHDGVWTQGSVTAPRAVPGTHVLKFRLDGADPEFMRGEFLPTRPCSITRNLRGSTWIVDVVEDAHGTLHVMTHERPASWHGLGAAHAAGDVVSTRGGHNGVDAVLDAAQHHGATLDMFGVPRDVNGAMVTQGPRRPGHLFFSWCEAAHAAAMNGGFAATSKARPVELHRGLLHHGVSTGDPDVFVGRLSTTNQVHLAVSGRRYHGAMGVTSAADGTDKNEPPPMIHVGTDYGAAQDASRGVVQCPKLMTDTLRARAAYLHAVDTADATAAGGAGSGNHVPRHGAVAVDAPQRPALHSSDPSLLGASTCTPTMDAGDGATPNCGTAVDDKIQALAISVVAQGAKMSKDAKNFCKAIKLFGAKDAVKGTSCAS